MEVQPNADRVEAIFRDCMFKDGEPTEGFVPAPGITIDVGFHPVRLASYREEVRAMIRELPESFMKNGGGGMSFLNLCNNRHDDQWTGFQQRMEQLVQLGIALGMASYCLPREYWGVMPGGVPYIQFDPTA